MIKEIDHSDILLPLKAVVVPGTGGAGAGAAGAGAAGGFYSMVMVILCWCPKLDFSWAEIWESEY